MVDTCRVGSSGEFVALVGWKGRGKYLDYEAFGFTTGRSFSCVGIGDLVVDGREENVIEL